MKQILLPLYLLILAVPVFGVEEPSAWPPADVAKVVGYRFRLEGNPESFSLIDNNQLNEKELERLMVKSVELNAAQTARLLKGAINGKYYHGAAGCYTPHHIFLFYDAAGKRTHVLEVCFSCWGIHAAPDLTEKQLYHYNFVTLAKLCDEIGLWGDSDVNDYLKALEERLQE